VADLTCETAVFFENQIQNQFPGFAAEFAKELPLNPPEHLASIRKKEE
jgi:hypothetical protein